MLKIFIISFSVILNEPSFSSIILILKYLISSSVNVFLYVLLSAYSFNNFLDIFKGSPLYSILTFLQRHSTPHKLAI